MRNIIKYNDDFNEWTNTLLYKNISLTLYSWKGDVGCVWVMSWRWGQTALLTPSSSSTIAALLSHLGLELLNRGSLRTAKPSVCKLILMLASCLQLTRTVWHLVILLFNTNLLLLFFRLFTQVHLLIDGSVEGQYITQPPALKIFQLWQSWLTKTGEMFNYCWSWPGCSRKQMMTHSVNLSLHSMLNYNIIVSLNSVMLFCSLSAYFTLGKSMNPLILTSYRSKFYHYCSPTKIALALNNLWYVIKQRNQT